MNLVTVEILESHRAGIVGGTVGVEKGKVYRGVYEMETDCGSFTVCSFKGNSSIPNLVYFEADKVKVLPCES